MLSEKSFKLFKKAAKELPAYKQFLKDQNFNPNSVIDISDLKKIPVLNKDNYLRKYRFEDLVWPKNLNKTLILCATSGSTGEPTYFTRDERLSEQYSKLLVGFINNARLPKSSRILIINGFGMGVWIGGILTHRALELAGSKAKYPIAILPTGYNRSEILKAFSSIALDFDQVIVSGYPPFIKDLIDEAIQQKINLSRLNLRFIFAAESFTENFRDYICKSAAVKDPVLDTMNIYGTADIGAMAHETPFSILVRRMAINRPKLLEAIFGQIEKTPTFAQYNPDNIEFEEHNGEIILTGNSAMPLIRYAIGDNGGVISSRTMKSILENVPAWNKLVKDPSVYSHLDNNPFIYVYERKDLVVSLHGINIYPEFIREGLLSDKVQHFATEKFTMLVNYDNQQNQFLEINVELKKEFTRNASITKIIHDSIIRSLRAKCSEFVEINKEYPPEKLVRIVLWPREHKKYFSPKGKQKWSIKA